MTTSFDSHGVLESPSLSESSDVVIPLALDLGSFVYSLRAWTCRLSAKGGPGTSL